MSRGNRPIGIGMDRVTPTEAYETGWEDGVCDSMLRATQYERILTDLIAELRVMGGEYDSGWAPLIPVADRAEARLREVQGE